MDDLLREKALLPWQSVQQFIKGSVVYLDAGSAHVLAAFPGSAAIVGAPFVRVEHECNITTLTALLVVSASQLCFEEEPS